MKYLRVGFNCLIVALFVAMVDGCLHRDPYVRLPSGYSIGAISAGSPCFLGYEPWNDGRSHSNWRALHSVGRSKEGEESEGYFLINEATDEVLEFDSPLAWEAERRARNAQPSTLSTDAFSGITGFKRHDPFVIGEYGEGYFILNTAEDTVTSFTKKAEWVQAVAAAGMSADDLVDPKSWSVQTRHPVFYVVMGGFVVITLPWVLRPLWAGRRATAVKSRSNEPTPGGSEPDTPQSP